MNNKYCAVVLAAGRGKRMRSELPKVMHEICGMSMVNHVLMNLRDAGIDDICVVTGNKSEQVREHIGEGFHFALQQEPNGTAGAVMAASEYIKQHSGGMVLVMCADAPLQSSAAIEQFISCCDEAGLALGVMSAVLSNPANYGRILRDENGRLQGIIEKNDCTPSQLKINEINSGTYLFDADKLLEVLGEISCENAAGEYYLTDAAELFVNKGYAASALVCEDENVVKGANDLFELSRCEAAMRMKINKALMLQGVKIIDPAATYIDRTVEIGIGTVIYPGTIIQGRTTIGENNTIISGRIVNSVIGSDNHIDSSLIESSTVRNNNKIGPYAHIRPGSEIKDNIRIGNFVEIKASSIDDGSKVSHLTYIGDGKVGKNVNFGCGVVFANYDGKNKYVSVVEDDAFVGCNVNLVAPVTIGQQSIIGAGTTVTKNVEKRTLVVGRAHQKTVKKLK